MKKILYTFLLVGLLSSASAQNFKFFQYGGLGISSIFSLKLNNVLKTNNLPRASLLTGSIRYGFDYSYKWIGGFLEGNLSVGGKNKSLTEMGMGLVGIYYKIPIKEKMNIKIGATYSYSGLSVHINNISGQNINANSLLNANGGNLIFVSSYSSLGGMASFSYGKNAIRFFCGFSLGGVNWRMPNNSVMGLSKESISTFTVDYTYAF